VRSTDFALPDRVRDEALLMKPIHGVPIKAFPCTTSVMPGQVEKRKDRFVDFFGIDVHRALVIIQAEAPNEGCEVRHLRLYI
jgi:hypothetical protein